MKANKTVSKELLSESKVLRKQNAELKLKEEDLSQLAAFVRTNPAPVLQTKYDGTIILANPVAYKVFGKHIVGKTVFPIFTHLKKSHLDKIIASKALQIVISIDSKEYQFTFKKDNKTKSIYIYGSDITERKKTMDRLEEAIKNLKETQVRLVQSEKMASLGMLVAGVAHEINTPLGAVKSMHDTLVRVVGKLKNALKEPYGEDLEENKNLDYLFKLIEDANNVINSGTERVANIVRRLRSFARLDEAELKDSDINEGIEDTLTLFHHELEHNVKIIKSYGDIPLISCYPGQLNQVFLNILINAKQAIKGKGEIRITTKQKEDYIHVMISDNGVGIAKKRLENIFDPGYTTKGVGVGTGLGLSICYQILQDHKGAIKVKSEVGKGTTFTIILPKNLESISASSNREAPEMSR